MEEGGRWRWAGSAMEMEKGGQLRSGVMEM
jgi:hypothetical protein